jgi:hypothetical protein
MSSIPEETALRYLNEGLDLIKRYSSENNLSEPDKQSLKVLHTSEIAHRTGQQKRTTTKLLNDILNDPDTRQPYQAAALKHNSVHLATLIGLADNPEYAKIMMELYQKEIEPQLTRS